jgi:hypothetical protein
MLHSVAQHRARRRNAILSIRAKFGSKCLFVGLIPLQILHSRTRILDKIFILIKAHIQLEAGLERWFHHLKFVWTKRDKSRRYGVSGASAPFEDARDQFLLLCGELGNLENWTLIWRNKLGTCRKFSFVYSLVKVHISHRTCEEG